MIRLRKSPRYWRLYIDDKLFLSNTRFCPPHTFPHTWPWGRKVKDEPCHLHKAKWRMSHHIPFCKLLKCPNCKFMMKKYQKFRKDS
ncbi:hypothetical protein ACFL96_05975 [Thermoproteota archaeon]